MIIPYRMLIVASLIVVVLIVAKGYQQAIFWRRVRGGLQLPAYKPGFAAILYFTAPGCTPCEIVQKPALAALQVEYSNQIQIFTHDATIDTDLARSWGVLTVPTTFLIDAQGRPRRVNHGPVQKEKLIEQLADINSPPGQVNRGRWGSAL